MGVEGVDSLGKEEVETFTLGLLGGGAVLLDVVREATPFWVAPAFATPTSAHHGMLSGKTNNLDLKGRGGLLFKNITTHLVTSESCLGFNLQ